MKMVKVLGLMTAAIVYGFVAGTVHLWWWPIVAGVPLGWAFSHFLTERET